MWQHLVTQEILLRANEAETKQNLDYVGRCDVLLIFIARGCSRRHDSRGLTSEVSSTKAHSRAVSTLNAEYSLSAAAKVSL